MTTFDSIARLIGIDSLTLYKGWQSGEKWTHVTLLPTLDEMYEFFSEIITRQNESSKFNISPEEYKLSDLLKICTQNKQYNFTAGERIFINDNYFPLEIKWIIKKDLSITKDTSFQDCTHILLCHNLKYYNLEQISPSVNVVIIKVEDSDSMNIKSIEILHPNAQS